MKVSDRGKVAMRKTLVCEERARLDTEASGLFAEWLASRDKVKMIPKNDSSFARKVKEMKDAHDKFRAADSRRCQHTLTHGCR